MPPEADALLQRLLARSPASRPRAADLVAELEGRAPPASARPEAASSTAVTAVLPAPVSTVQRPAASTTVVAAAPPRPGFSVTTGLIALVLIGLGLVVAAVAAGTADKLDVRRDGIDTAARLTQHDARAGLGILLGAGLTTFGLALLAIWSVRAAGRGRRATTRAAMAVVALLACAAAAAAVVWTAYAAGGDAGELWRRASLR